MRTKPARSAADERLIAALDIGTGKVCCLVIALAPEAAASARTGRPLPARVVGFGHHRSRGIKAGLVIDMGEAEESIRAAVSRAEASTGRRLDEVVLSVSCGRIRSTVFTASVPVRSGVVGEAELTRALAAGSDYAGRDGRSLLHMHRLGYRLDGLGGIRNPLGMAAETLGIELNAVTADDQPLGNLLTLAQRCYLAVGDMAAAPYASALAVLTEEEAELGASVVDMGAGTTTLAMFAEGKFLHCDGIVLGGHHISSDIAHALSTPLVEAERIKTFHGNLILAASDEHELIPFPGIGEDDSGVFHHTSRAHLTRLVRPRVEQTLRLVEERLQKSGLAGRAGGRIVLTGGASQLTGMGQFAAQVLGRSVRIGAPRPLADMPASLASPEFATAIGLAHAVVAPGVAARAYQDTPESAGAGGYLRRVGLWLKESFWDEGRTA